MIHHLDAPLIRVLFGHVNAADNGSSRTESERNRASNTGAGTDNQPRATVEAKQALVHSVNPPGSRESAAILFIDVLATLAMLLRAADLTKSILWITCWTIRCGMP